MTKKMRNKLKKESLIEMPVKKGFLSGTGRRKTATASVFLYQEKGEFLVNGKPLKDYFVNEVAMQEWYKPFHIVGVSHPDSQFSGTIKVSGSGKSAQIQAIIHGVSRALAQISEENAVSLRKQGLLTRDSRMVERKKPFLKKARKAPQYTKR